MQGDHGEGWLCGCGRLNPDDTQFCGTCGAGTSAQSVQNVSSQARAERSGEVLDGRFRLQKKLGEGGMGEVYLAHDERLGRQVAVKLLAPELMANEQARRRMWQEGQTLARIDDVNVVKVFDLFEVAAAGGQTIAMAMELVSGGDLRQRIQRGPIPWLEACALVTGVLSGLSAIHTQGLVHRDIKPGNVLLSTNGTPKVADLGVARDVSGRMKTRTGQVLGTAAYMSPEQIKAEPVDARSDLYAVGLLLFELITGTHLFEGTSEFEMQVAHASQKPNLKALNKHGAKAIKSVLETALSKEKGARFSSAEAMRSALQQALVSASAPGVGPNVVVEAVQAGDVEGEQAPSLMGAFGYCMKRYAKFSGRASRTEYIGFSLTVFVLFFVVVLLGILMGSGGGMSMGGGELIFILLMFLIIIPGLALQVRRLHDTNTTGWATLAAMIPYIGLAITLWCVFAPGTEGPNRFGPAVVKRN